MAGFDTYLRTMLDRAATEARRDGSTTVEAQHLLLAIAADQGSATSLALASAGLDADTIREALDREFAYSLTAAGVDRAAFDLPPASPDPQRVPHPGDSVRLALERGVNSAADRAPQPAHLLIGILRAEVGTVPRALAMAGVDRADLIARMTETLSR